MVGQVVTANPTVGKFMLVDPISVTGMEAEGLAGVVTANGSVSVPVYLVGPGAPVAGDWLVCRFVDYRWVAERKATNQTQHNPCQCTWPRKLNYRGSIGQAESAFYFINLYGNGSYSGPEPSSYTLTYGPRPADIPQHLQLLYYSAPGGIHDPYFINMPDSAWFSDPVPAVIFGYQISVYFYLWIQGCRANVMVIDTPYGNNVMNYGPGSGARGAGNNVFTYIQTQCAPQFQMRGILNQPPQITGNHGSDDLIPPSTGTLGVYTGGTEGV